MKLRTLVWFSGLWWLMPLQVIATHYMLSANDPARNGYALATQVWVLEAQNLTLPLTALAGAIAASRTYRSGTLDRAIGRPMFTVFIPIGGVLAGGTLLVSVGFQVGHIGLGNLENFNFLMLLAPALWALGAASLGAVFGKLLPLPLAAPLAVLVVYVVLGFPSAFEPPWIRHMTPVILGCCDYRDQLDARVIGAAVLSAAGLIGASAIILARMRGSHSLTAVYSLTTLFALLTASGLTVVDLSYDAKQPRQSGLECHDFGFEVCIWPETRAALMIAANDVLEINEIASSKGIQKPARFVDQDSLVLSEDDTEFVIWSDAAPDEIRNSLVAVMMPQLSEACFRELEYLHADKAIAASFTAETMSKQWWDAQFEPASARAKVPAVTPDELNIASAAIRACDRVTLESLW